MVWTLLGCSGYVLFLQGSGPTLPSEALIRLLPKGLVVASLLRYFVSKFFSDVCTWKSRQSFHVCGVGPDRVVTFSVRR